MPFNITLDYRFDSNGFFENPEARAAMEAAAAAWEAVILDRNHSPIGCVGKGGQQGSLSISVLEWKAYYFFPLLPDGLASTFFALMPPRGAAYTPSKFPTLRSRPLDG